MNKALHICDKCGKQEITDSHYTPPVGWENIEIKYKQYTSRKYEVCPECKEKLGLPIEAAYKTAGEEKSIADRLLEIIEEIAYGVNQS